MSTGKTAKKACHCKRQSIFIINEVEESRNGKGGHGTIVQNASERFSESAINSDIRLNFCPDGSI